MKKDTQQKPDLFIQFVQRVGPKVGHQQAFSLFSDCTRNALINILIEKGVFTQIEYDIELKKQIEKVAEGISKMPIPSSIQVTDIRR